MALSGVAALNQCTCLKLTHKRKPALHVLTVELCHSHESHVKVPRAVASGIRSEQHAARLGCGFSPFITIYLDYFFAVFVLYLIYKWHRESLLIVFLLFRLTCKPTVSCDDVVHLCLRSSHAVLSSLPVGMEGRRSEPQERPRSAVARLDQERRSSRLTGVSLYKSRCGEDCMHAAKWRLFLLDVKTGR